MPPRSHKRVTKLAAGFDEERRAAHGDVANLEFKDLRGRRVLAQAFKNGFECLSVKERGV